MLTEGQVSGLIPREVIGDETWHVHSMERVLGYVIIHRGGLDHFMKGLRFVILCSRNPTRIQNNR